MWFWNLWRHAEVQNWLIFYLFWDHGAKLLGTILERKQRETLRNEDILSLSRDLQAGCWLLYFVSHSVS